MKRIAISVTADDIRMANVFINGHGEPLLCSCPVALAARRVLKRPLQVMPTSITVDRPGDGAEFIIDKIGLPTIARNWIVSFDRWLADEPDAPKPYPISFNLDVPDWVLA